ncbi:MAG TPA: allantoate amidohydrolase [Usitatibacter sp.]|nr:allantoate amidohydrolase [Usitatibacter sp.]
MRQPPFDRTAAGHQLLERVQVLGRHSDAAGHYTRTFLTPAHQAAARQIAHWMREAGMEVRVDAVGNVIGRYAAAAETRDGPGIAPSPNSVLLLGSHFDSVRNGGKYDGVLGILVPIACVAQLNQAGERLDYAIEVAAFSDEEGARFQTSFLSSRAMIGRFDPAVLDRRDADGVSFVDAMRAAGLDPAKIGEAGIDTTSLAAYVEVHIEQGPVLLKEGRPLGVVTSIAGGSRHLFTVRGEAGHAGTVPMPMRRDALAAAAEMVLAIESRCSAGGSLVGTVGILKVRDGTGNVIPGEVEFTCDIRAADDVARKAAEADVIAKLEAIAARRGVELARKPTHEVRAAPCAAWLQDRLAASVERVLSRDGNRRAARRLPSGAGHDAMVMAEVTDAGMLFVRCGAGGVSHNPAETVSEEDAGAAAEALLDFLRVFEPRSSR